jgi:hypothetical protein
MFSLSYFLPPTLYSTSRTRAGCIFQFILIGAHDQIGFGILFVLFTASKGTATPFCPEEPSDSDDRGASLIPYPA